ncbi:MAG: hypothetical protein RR450_04765 [Oscillospiraceae bacterium]
MKLIEIRRLFAKHSGRYDLVDHLTGADTGADFFINSGRQMLDRLSTIGAQQATTFDEVQAGKGIVIVPEVFLLESVIWRESGMVERELREVYVGKLTKALSQPGSPTAYQIVPIEISPNIEKIPLPDFAVISEHAEVHKHVGETTAIQLFPKPNRDGVLQVSGHFYSQKLQFDDDYNIWSMKFPDLLVSASLWALEVFYRNTEGANDWMTHVVGQLREQDKRELENKIRHIDQMEG